MASKESRHAWGEDEQALSEIVGALMLVLVVVIAATSFGMFYIQNQKRTEAQQALVAERGLEAMIITKIVATPAGGPWTSLDFTVTSTSTKGMHIAGFNLNDVPVSTWTLTRQDGSHDETEYTPWTAGQPALAVQPLERLVLHMSGVSIPATSVVTLDVLTERQNTFTKAFMPPTAVAQFEETTTANTLLLDGSMSGQPTEGARIVSWSWSTATGPACAGAAAGKVVRLAIGGTGGPGTVCIVTLTVTDSFGMTATDTFDYTTV
jgi:flagellin-like protein